MLQRVRSCSEAWLVGTAGSPSASLLKRATPHDANEQGGLASKVFSARCRRCHNEGVFYTGRYSGTSAVPLHRLRELFLEASERVFDDVTVKDLGLQSASNRSSRASRETSKLFVHTRSPRYACIEQP